MKNTDNMLEDNGISTKFPPNNKLPLFFMPFLLILLKDGSWHILVPIIIVTERTEWNISATASMRPNCQCECLSVPLSR